MKIKRFSLRIEQDDETCFEITQDEYNSISIPVPIYPRILKLVYEISSLIKEANQMTKTIEKKESQKDFGFQK